MGNEKLMSIGRGNCSHCDHLLSLFSFLGFCLLLPSFFKSFFYAYSWFWPHTVISTHSPWWPHPLSSIHAMRISTSSPDFPPNSTCSVTYNLDPSIQVSMGISNSTCPDEVIILDNPSISHPIHFSPIIHLPKTLPSEVSHHPIIITGINLPMWNSEAPTFFDPCGLFTH